MEVRSCLFLLVTVACVSALPTPELAPDNDTLPTAPAMEQDFMMDNSSLDLTDTNATTGFNDTELGGAGVDDMFRTVRDHIDAASAGRDKERRLEVIRALILDTTGRTKRPPGSTTGPVTSVIKDLKSILKSMLPWSSVDGYAEKVQSFYPVCVLPKVVSDTDEREAMNLFFNLSYPTPLEGSVLNILAAKLKLYKMSQVNQSSPSSLPCTPRRSLDTAALEAAAAVATGSPLPAEAYVEDDRRVRVSVYYYLRAQRKNRLRRKLLDTKMVSLSGDEWVELNVRAAARSWRNTAKNLGLVVEVEDEEGKPLPASKFFSAMNCSQEAATSKPIPSFLLDAAREKQRHGAQNSTLHYSTDLFPVIDLCTMDLPKQERKPLASSLDVSGSPSDAHNKHGEGVTSLVLMPFSRVAELASKQAGEEDEEEKNESRATEHQHEPPMYELPAEVPEPLESEPPLHQHRHHRHQKAAHEPEHDSEEQSGEHSEEETESWLKRHPHRLHHKYHHSGHRFHAAEEARDPGRLVVVPASELLALSEQLEREDERLQRTLHHQER